MPGRARQPDPDEAARLSALDGLAILDTAPEPGFDDIVLLASRICETPVALVSLVTDNRQWFKARIGFPACETPLSQSVCAQALRQSETLVIPDLTLDERTRRNRLVTHEPFIRFYAGAQLHSGDGVAIGTLCVIDTGPRPGGLTPVQIGSLEALARQVTAQLDLRRTILQRDQALAAEAVATQRRELLSQELSHRLKNILAMVQAVASQTLRNATSLASAREALLTRIAALGKAHEMLFEGGIGSATIAAIVREATKLHEDGHGQRFRISGRDIEVGAKAALMLALMMHELATNAAKYGALSTPDGVVAISWATADEAGQPVLTLSWSESGGPPVAPPQRTGFGSRLIERALAGTIGGVATLDYAPAGMTCRLRAPISGLHDAEESRLRGLAP